MDVQPPRGGSDAPGSWSADVACTAVNGTAAASLPYVVGARLRSQPRQGLAVDDLGVTDVELRCRWVAMPGMAWMGRYV